MEHRHKRADRKRTRSLDEPTAGDGSAVDTLSLPNIAELIDYGEITIGVVRPVGCVAVANDDDNCVAMLVRRHGETLAQLLTRLDLTIANAFTEDIFTDEINPRPSNVHTHPYNEVVSISKDRGHDLTHSCSHSHAQVKTAMDLRLPANG